jgi:hypothetical protein
MFLFENWVGVLNVPVKNDLNTCSTCTSDHYLADNGKRITDSQQKV